MMAVAMMMFSTRLPSTATIASTKSGKTISKASKHDDLDVYRPVGRLFGNFYAAQTFLNAPNGRRIQIGWGQGITFPGMPFNQQMTFPVELSLRSRKDCGTRSLEKTSMA